MRLESRCYNLVIDNNILRQAARAIGVTAESDTMNGRSGFIGGARNSLSVVGRPTGGVDTSYTLFVTDWCKPRIAAATQWVEVNIATAGDAQRRKRASVRR